jgi:hypothetical protein
METKKAGVLMVVDDGEIRIEVGEIGRPGLDAIVLDARQARAIATQLEQAAARRLGRG